MTGSQMWRSKRDRQHARARPGAVSAAMLSACSASVERQELRQDVFWVMAQVDDDDPVAAIPDSIKPSAFVSNLQFLQFLRHLQLPEHPKLRTRAEERGRG